MSGTESPPQEQDLEALVAEILPAQMPVQYEEGSAEGPGRGDPHQSSAAGHGLLWKRDARGEAAQAVREEDLEQLGFSFYSREEQIRIWGLEKWEQYEEKCGQAAEETAGQVLSLGGDAGLPEDVPYHAVSAGRTRDGEAFGEPYSWLTRWNARTICMLQNI